MPGFSDVERFLIFFCSVEHLTMWAANGPRAGQALTLEDVIDLGPRLWGMMR